VTGRGLAPAGAGPRSVSPRSRGHHWSRNNNQRIIVITRNFNFSKSDTDRAQPDKQRQQFKSQRRG